VGKQRNKAKERAEHDEKQAKHLARVFAGNVTEAKQRQPNFSDDDVNTRATIVDDMRSVFAKRRGVVFGSAKRLSYTGAARINGRVSIRRQKKKVTPRNSNRQSPRSSRKKDVSFSFSSRKSRHGGDESSSQKARHGDESGSQKSRRLRPSARQNTAAVLSPRSILRKEEPIQSPRMTDETESLGAREGGAEGAGGGGGGRGTPRFSRHVTNEAFTK